MTLWVIYTVVSKKDGSDLGKGVTSAAFDKAKLETDLNKNAVILPGIEAKEWAAEMWSFSDAILLTVQLSGDNGDFTEADLEQVEDEFLDAMDPILNRAMETILPGVGFRLNYTVEKVIGGAE